MAHRHKLAQGGAPLLFIEFATYAEHRYLVMAELLDAVGHAADQDIDQVHRPKTLAGAIGAGQQFLRDHLAIAQLRRRKAVAAIATFGGAERLAEISEQAGAAAARRSGQSDR